MEDNISALEKMTQIYAAEYTAYSLTCKILMVKIKDN